MPRKITVPEICEIERDGSLLGIRFFPHYDIPINIIVNFQEQKVWYKDGNTWNGRWQPILLQTLEKGDDKDGSQK